LQVITINGLFPGPLINATTNDNIHVNAFNDLDEPLLFTWYIDISMVLCVFFFHYGIDLDL
jgi:hypothetical protein